MAQEFGKPIFYMPDLTFTKMVLEEISISNPRNPGQSRTYTVLFVASSESKIGLIFNNILHEEK